MFQNKLQNPSHNNCFLKLNKIYSSECSTVPLNIGLRYILGRKLFLKINLYVTLLQDDHGFISR